MYPDPRRLGVPEDIGNDDELNNNNDGGDNEASVTNDGEENGGTAIINNSHQIHRVTWKDVNGQTKQIHNLVLDTYLNTLDNTAMFKLYVSVTLKGASNKRKTSKIRVYLHMYPEWIQAITYETSPDTQSTTQGTARSDLYSLHFSMTQRPDLIGPKGRSLASDSKTRTQLDLIQDLASVTEFVVHLDSTNTVTPRQGDFELLASSFSPMCTNTRPCTDDERANLSTLYAGIGGVIINSDKGVALTEASPPCIYTAGSLVSADCDCDCDCDCDGDSDVDYYAVANTLHSMQDACARLHDMSYRFELRFQNLERSMEELRQIIDNWDTDYAPYMAEYFRRYRQRSSAVDP